MNHNNLRGVEPIDKPQTGAGSNLPTVTAPRGMLFRKVLLWRAFSLLFGARFLTAKFLGKSDRAVLLDPPTRLAPYSPRVFWALFCDQTAVRRGTPELSWQRVTAASPREPGTSGRSTSETEMSSNRPRLSEVSSVYLAALASNRPPGVGPVLAHNAGAQQLITFRWSKRTDAAALATKS